MAVSSKSSASTTKVPVRSLPTNRNKSVSIADAKATFSSLVSRVETKRLPITILRRGVPVAQIVPVDQPTLASGYGWMRGSVQELGDIIGPTGMEWTAGDE
jgi:prevent-host-death family protein